MKFQVNRDVFSEAVSFAVKLLPQRTTLPILSGVLIETNDGGLSLSSFDYEISARTEIVADVDETGRILVSGRLLADIASRLPNAPVLFATEGNHIIVTCGSAHFTLLSMPVEELMEPLRNLTRKVLISTIMSLMPLVLLVFNLGSLFSTGIFHLLFKIKVIVVLG